MHATAKAHPIQGLVKYHGMRDAELRYPYHDSISVCTAPSHTKTTVSFEADEETYVVDGETVTGRGAERIESVLDHVRDLADIDRPARVESENSFPTNVGFGSSSSGFAALAMAAAEAAGLDLTRPEVSTIARRGSASAARAVTGGFSVLYSGKNDDDCRAERIETDLDDELHVVTALVPTYKETEAAHAEATESHMFDARMAHIHEQMDEMRDALRAADFGRAFELAERDTLSLAATTMTGPSAWVYWQPQTIEIFNAVRQLRSEGVEAYFSGDTGASIYVNTTEQHVEDVREAISDLGIETRHWTVGGPAEILDDEALF
ncbi:phosphomevalonate decarboxylase MvaD [Halapricum hydrolyticum]|uniref:Phosphomevalonate decarboxylase MvaD n=1 Tax=Halapricum hydrolyticum TaxID=2979991 RepID=A0AAE3LHM3_9EURY|nr:phosphomevalonate decarboxylase MvaD [Halapricum hydrolyticum]MCU4717899.1 phosphomevalonate decarboxylase MvaD [Halapricum hydrolyticum]MCU4727064.1 phosphomevalonate decarboxylase MvaD [Halapricum hydrolyticum]